MTTPEIQRAAERLRECIRSMARPGAECNAERDALDALASLTAAASEPSISDQLSLAEFAQLMQAARESKWIPHEHYRIGDWVIDCCQFLREGPESFDTEPRGEPVAAEQCRSCGDDAIHRLVMDNIPDAEGTPICGRCSQHHEAMAQDTNDHEMRNFDGAYGLVAFHYEPLASPPAPTVEPTAEPVALADDLMADLRRFVCDCNTTDWSAELIDRIDAATQTSPPAPQGWVSVPVEPTEAASRLRFMIDNHTTISQSDARERREDVALLIAWQGRVPNKLSEWVAIDKHGEIRNDLEAGYEHARDDVREMIATVPTAAPIAGASDE